MSLHFPARLRGVLTRSRPKSSGRQKRASLLPQPVLSPDGQPKLRTGLEEVLGFIRAHKKNGYTPPFDDEPLPDEHAKFDDIARYGLSEEQEDKLWKIEAVRLVAAVEDFDLPLRFESPVSDWAIDKAEFEKLSELGDQALHCLNICMHDNELLNFESMRDLFNPQSYLRARNILSNAFSQAGGNPHERGGAPRTKSQPADLDIHGKTHEIFCAFVDYVTATIARFALNGIPSEFWHIRALAGLAKHAAKMKFLFTDLEKFAIQSLEDGQDVLAKDEALTALGIGSGPVLDIVGTDGQPFQVRKSSEDPTGRKDITDSADIHRLLTLEDQDTHIYFSEMAMVSSWAIDALRAMFYFFQRSIRSGYATDAFDICSLVYKAGLNGLLTLVYQDRDGELMGSSLREFIRLSHPSFKMLAQAAEVIEAEQQRSPPSGPVHAPIDSSGATFVLDFEEERPRGAATAGFNAGNNLRLHLSTMGDLASLLVPLLCANPMQLTNLRWAMEIVTSVSSVKDTIDFNALPGPNFTVFASLRTDVYEREVQPKMAGSDARSLSRSLIAQNRLRAYDQRETTDTKVWESLPVAERRDKTDGQEERMHEIEAKFKSWDIAETAVVVKKPWFVFWVLLICAVLVIGGIMVGVFLGSRLEGVDPFNITVYAWALAGVIILVCKALLVSEWPWRDFLQGRVPCRSISELHSVTGVKPQEILEYLLSRELYTILTTKGPYNRPFLRKADDGAEGFSIDEKIELRTLLASGILVVKVAGRQGPGLVFMDLRRGANGRGKITHTDKPDDEEYLLGCFDLVEAFDEGQDVPLLRVRHGWTRIVGIYHNPKKEFR